MVPDHRLKGACVLLVENDEPTAKLVTAVLRDEGCNVQVVKGGLPGLALLLAGLQVTAALLDLRLPDVSGLDVADVDFESLSQCRVGSCDMNLPAAAIQKFRAVAWSAPAARAQARHALQTTLVDYVNDYQARGNSALVVYEDRGSPMPLAARSAALFAGSDGLASVGGLAAYFTKYRSLPLPADAEEFFYWQQLTFGMKPVTRVNHLVIIPQTIDGRPSWVAVSRMIYASHYFRDGLEVRYLVPVDASPSSNAFYLVLISRSHSESLAGLKGLLLGGIIRRKVRDSTARHVAHVKERVEERP